MTTTSRIDTDVVFHDTNGNVFTLGSVSEHVRGTLACQSVSATLTTATVSLTTTLATLSAVAIKNSGSSVIRIAGAISVPAGRVAVLPVTATFTVASVSGAGEYQAVCVG